jgi:excisionase family DNA binding protein
MNRTAAKQVSVSVREAAAILQRPENCVQRLIVTRQLSAVREGRRYSLDLGTVAAFAQRMRLSVSTDDAARILRISPNTIRRRIAAGELRCWRYGRWYKIERSAIIEYLTDPPKESAA